MTQLLKDVTKSEGRKQKVQKCIFLITPPVQAIVNQRVPGWLVFVFDLATQKGDGAVVNVECLCLSVGKRKTDEK